MNEWDANGTRKNAYGELEFKRWAKWTDDDGNFCTGGIHLLDSTDAMLRVQVAELVSEEVTPAASMFSSGTSRTYKIGEKIVWLEVGTVEIIDVDLQPRIPKNFPPDKR